MDDVAAFLRRHPPFDSLDAAAVAAVADAAQEEHHPAGALILERPDATSEHAFVVRRCAARPRRGVLHRGSSYGAAPIIGVAAGSSSACEASVPVLCRCTNQ